MLKVNMPDIGVITETWAAEKIPLIHPDYDCH